MQLYAGLIAYKSLYIARLLKNCFTKQDVTTVHRPVGEVCYTRSVVTHQCPVARINRGYIRVSIRAGLFPDRELRIVGNSNKLI